MNKTELVDKLAAKTGLSKGDANKAVDELFDIVTETLAAGETLQLIGFGSFSVGARAARVGRNPQTGAEIRIAAAKVPKFTPGKGLKERVNTIGE